MKTVFKIIIATLLKWEAMLVLRKYKPKIVAISGTVGKTSTKNAAASVLSKKFFVRKSEKSYNSEFGVPLTVLGKKSGWNNPLRWLLILFSGIKLLIVRYDYPEWLVLELGVDSPNDMRKLMSWIKPDIAVLTAVGEVPVHVENFKRLEDLVREKSRLVLSLNPEDYAVLNGDDDCLFELSERVKANTLTYGFYDDENMDKRLDLVASNYHVTYKNEGDVEIPNGVTFKVDYGGSSVPVRLYNIFGKQGVYSALSALTIGIAVGINLVEMVESLSHYKSPPGRLKLLKGIKNSFILDDTYNSSPLAVSAALDVVEDIKAKRKIVVLGDMLELGKHTIDEHKKVGKRSSEVADIIIVVGARAKFISEEARENKFAKNKIFEFSNSDEAKMPLQEMIEEGDFILIKGSQSIRMEKIVEEIMAEPENKEDLLVRQSEDWLKR